MSSTGAQLNKRKGAALVRIIVTINFVLLLLLLSPLGRSRDFYRAIKDAGLGVLVSTWLPLWVVLTTLIATALYFWRKLRKQAVLEEHRPKRTLDGALLLAWWIVLVGACMYAFMMGMGG